MKFCVNYDITDTFENVLMEISNWFNSDKMVLTGLVIFFRKLLTTQLSILFKSRFYISRVKCCFLRIVVRES